MEDCEAARETAMPWILPQYVQEGLQREVYFRKNSQHLSGVTDPTMNAGTRFTRWFLQPDEKVAEICTSKSPFRNSAGYLYLLLFVENIHERKIMISDVL